MKIQEVLDKELEKVKLKKENIKELEALASDFIRKIKNENLNAFLGGSLAKGTIIKKDIQDIDVFVVFDNEKEILNLEKILKKIKINGELRKIHGSRDYFQFITPIAKLEIVPTVKTKSPEKANNVTDVSLSHVKYVKGKLYKNPNLINEIILAKSFCYANHFYGAESFIKGFSGYSLEILIIYFGGFINFLKKVNQKRVLDPEKYFKNEKQVLFELNSSKLEGPLILIDPTYKYRNVTAGLGHETYEKFLKTAKDFLKNPLVDFFDLKEINEQELVNFSKKNKASLYKINLRSDKQEGDIAGTKCKKFLDFFSNELKRNKQDVIRKEFFYGGNKLAVGYLAVKEENIIELKGPPVKMNEKIKEFNKRHKNTYVKKGYVWAKKSVRIIDIFNKANRVKDEMGSWGEDILKI